MHTGYAMRNLYTSIGKVLEASSKAPRSWQHAIQATVVDRVTTVSNRFTVSIAYVCEDIIAASWQDPDIAPIQVELRVLLQNLGQLGAGRVLS